MWEIEAASKGLVRLIYASRWAKAGGAGLAEEVRIITAKSIHNNRLVDITGFLAFGGDRFLQLLEGPAGEVDTTFGRIRSDSRHADVTVIARGQAERRLFRDWNMAQHQVSAADKSVLAAAGLKAFTPEVLDETGAMEVLTALGGRHRR